MSQSHVLRATTRSVDLGESFQIDPNSNEYLLAKIGVVRAENEPLEVWGENSIHYSFASLGASTRRSGCLRGEQLGVARPLVRHRGRARA